MTVQIIYVTFMQNIVSIFFTFSILIVINFNMKMDIANRYNRKKCHMYVYLNTLTFPTSLQVFVTIERL